ncbi:hypothetical protein RF11_02085 [Thelohanellus kitauei]|uniref:Uncharacterized protein n=1 Tax=Thelohanellus kitauei TaxID=669202 RepID=A0A0C2MQ16_THEKT|nr:hypothetical protein RF11_02085 [Thelohanellus kitauei]
MMVRKYERNKYVKLTRAFRVENDYLNYIGDTNIVNQMNIYFSMLRNEVNNEIYLDIRMVDKDNKSRSNISYGLQRKRICDIQYPDDHINGLVNDIPLLGIIHLNTKNRV